MVRTVTKTIKVQPKTHSKVKRLAKLRQSTLSGVIDWLLDKELRSIALAKNVNKAIKAGKLETGDKVTKVGTNTVVRTVAGNKIIK